MMKAYIATKFTNTDGFYKMKAILEAAGHEVIHDWTKDDPAKKDEYPAYAATCAMAIYAADALVFLPTTEPMAGAFVELGLGIAFWKRVVIINPPEGAQECIFYHLPESAGVHQRVNTMEEVPAVLATPLVPPVAQVTVPNEGDAN